jgi:phosphatidylinositol alpha-1,6-mannosyltransferase
MAAMRRTLIVTNDFPPRQGGIQSFVHALALRLPPDKLTVYAPKWEGAREFDANQPWPSRRPGRRMPSCSAPRRRWA